MRSFSDGGESRSLILVRQTVAQHILRTTLSMRGAACQSVCGIGRPAVVVQCVWVVGWLVRFFVLDQDQAHDASCIADCLARTLEEVSVIMKVDLLGTPRSISAGCPGQFQPSIENLTLTTLLFPSSFS